MSSGSTPGRFRQEHPITLYHPTQPSLGLLGDPTSSKFPKVIHLLPVTSPFDIVRGGVLDGPNVDLGLLHDDLHSVIEYTAICTGATYGHLALNPGQCFDASRVVRQCKRSRRSAVQQYRLHDAQEQIHTAKLSGHNLFKGGAQMHTENRSFGL